MIKNPLGLAPYSYVPLSDPDKIRVLCVRGAPESADLIDCKLEEQNLEEAKYEALSWYWGDEEPKREIRIRQNNKYKSFVVREHLYQALRALRHEEEDRFLWIDAICIHQDNLEERNTQVPRMDKIYGNAVNVCVWLGMPKDAVEQKKFEAAFMFIRDQLLKLLDFDTLLQNKHIESWEALLHVMKLPWFSRRWVVQEISLAQKATIHIGRYKADWDDFADAVSLFVQVEDVPRKLSELAQEKGHFDERGHFDEVEHLGSTLLVKTTKDLFRRSPWGGHYKQLTLENLVSRLGVFESSEPRDTIYGLLAMARDTQPYADEALRYLDPGDRELIERVAAMFPTSRKARYEVDYKAPIIDVYQEFIAFALRNADPTRALDVVLRPFAYRFTKEKRYEYDHRILRELSDAQKNTLVDLPSWMPSIANLPFELQSAHRVRSSLESGKYFDEKMKRRYGNSFVGPPDARNYSAAGSRRLDRFRIAFRKGPEGDDDYYSMFVDGFILDTVKQKTEGAQHGNIPKDWFEMIGWNDRTKDPPKAEEWDLWDQFWRTLIGNRDARGVDPPIYYRRAGEEAFKNYRTSSTFETGAMIMKGQSAISAYFRQVQATIWERCLIKTGTEENPMLGLADREVATGDKVCILYGCSVPVIMRRVEKAVGDLDKEKKLDEKERERRRKRAAEWLQVVFAKRRKRAGTTNGVFSAAQIMLKRLLGSSDTGAVHPSIEANKGRSQLNVKSRPLTREKEKYFEKLDAQLRDYKRAKQAEKRLSDRLIWGRLYRLRHIWRTIILLVMAAVVEYRGDSATANLIALALLTDVISYASNVSPDVATDWTISVLAFAVMVILIAVSTLISPRRKQVTLETLTIYSICIVIFPQVLPPAFRRTFNRTRDRYETWLDAIQEDADAKPKSWSNVSMQLLGKLTRRARRPRNLQPVFPQRTNHFYRIIGECYIHGMMEGEAIKRQNENGIRPETFEIR